MNAYSLRTLNHAELEREIARLESEVDRLDDATWPGACRQQAELMDRLARLRAEAERRRC